MAPILTLWGARPVARRQGKCRRIWLRSPALAKASYLRLERLVFPSSAGAWKGRGRTRREGRWCHGTKSDRSMPSRERSPLRGSGQTACGAHQSGATRRLRLQSGIHKRTQRISEPLYQHTSTTRECYRIAMACGARSFLVCGIGAVDSCGELKKAPIR